MRHQLQRFGHAWRLVPPKTTRSRRTISLPAYAVQALRQHRVRQNEERLAAAPWRMPEGRDLVFATRVGSPLDSKNVTHRFQDVLRRRGLPRIRFHDLRHSCATLLHAHGVHARVVTEILGHSEIGTTMNIYSHVIPQLQREAAEQMDAALRRTR